MITEGGRRAKGRQKIVLWDGEVIPGYVATPKKNRDDTAAIAAFNRRLAADPRLYTSILQAGDGVSVSVKLAS